MLFCGIKYKWSDRSH
uniref:Uncharacterized protein n=1 Tax=Arundo donax TaxID=35708 RepID=A0A0A9H3Y4_ARUDO